MISVIIPVFNAAGFVREAVESALEQPAVAVVILIEDGSSDDSPAVCAHLARASSRVTLLRHADRGNHGAGASRNRGIDAAATEFVAFLDADDFYLPDRFRKAVAVLDADPQVDGVYEAVAVQAPGTALPAAPTFTARLPVAPADLLRALAVGHWGAIHLNGITIRRTAFARCGYFPEDMREAQDTVWILKAAATTRLLAGELRQPVAVLRIHEANRVSGRRSDSQPALDRARQRNQVLLDWGTRALTAEQMALVEIFAARRLAEAHAARFQNRFARYMVKRSLMLWYARATPRLWSHPALLAALLPAFLSAN